LPISFFRLEIEGNNTAALHRPEVMIGYNHRRSHQQSGVVDHVTQPIKSSLESKESMRADVRRHWKIVSTLPCKFGIRGNRNLISVPEIERTRVCILCARLNELATYFRHRDAQRLPSKYKQIAPVMNVLLNRFPGIGRGSGTVGKNQQICAFQSPFRL